MAEILSGVAEEIQLLGKESDPMWTLLLSKDLGRVDSRWSGQG